MDAARPVESINKNLCWHGRHRALLLQAAPGHQASLTTDCGLDTCLGGSSLVDEVCRLRVVSTLSRFSNGTATSITSVPITSKSFGVVLGCNFNYSLDDVLAMVYLLPNFVQWQHNSVGVASGEEERDLFHSTVMHPPWNHQLSYHRYFFGVLVKKGLAKKL